MDQNDCKTAMINGVELEYWDIGSGPPIVFIHGGMGDECTSVIREPMLTSRFRLIHFHRRGYGRSDCQEMPVPVSQHSDDCQALLDYLDVRIAHVVGQSYGGVVSLQLVADAPATVRTLTVLEPALPSVLFASPEFAALGQQANELYQDGKCGEAIELFGRTVVGDKGWSDFSSVWLERWFDDAVVMFESDFPALGTWGFSSAEAKRISQPVLNLLGADSPVFFKKVSEAVAEWIPHAENHVVPDTGHCILQANPSGAAQYIAQHIERHPIAE